MPRPTAPEMKPMSAVRPSEPTTAAEVRTPLTGGCPAGVPAPPAPRPRSTSTMGPEPPPADREQGHRAAASKRHAATCAPPLGDGRRPWPRPIAGARSPCGCRPIASEGEPGPVQREGQRRHADRRLVEDRSSQRDAQRRRRKRAIPSARSSCGEREPGPGAAAAWADDVAHIGEAGPDAYEGGRSPAPPRSW